jgi:pimeloyl-ACP methyl ester carboxylesterase
MSASALSNPEVYEGGSGSTLVLLHGFGGNWRMWQPLFKLLEPHHRVVAPTLPGHSGGVVLTKRASPVTIAEALAEQLRSRGITNAHFVGQSLGGFQAFEMVRHGLARSALGLSPAGAWKDRQTMVKFVRDTRATFKLFPYLMPVLKPLLGIPSARKLIMRREMEHGDRISAAEVRDAFRRIFEMTIVEDFLDENMQPIAPLPKTSKVPLRVVWCGSDRVLPFEDYGRPLLEVLGLKSHVGLPGCGHNPNWDDPESVAAAILEFTKAVESGFGGDAM